MAQQTYYVNCPHCSEIIEVVNPKPNTDVRHVVGTSDSPHPWFAKPDTWFTIKCPKCSEHVCIRWWFNW